ncbi:MAG: asparagine synthase-related protein [Candidatus Aminicenantaceae bacterium]
MSAITGIIGKKIEKKHMEEMLKKIHHRGPDRSKIQVFSDGGVAAGELSLSNRSTPALSGEEKPLVLMDGDIYNSIPEGMSNVEYVRQLYMKEGKKCFSKLDGSFSCAIIDNDETILVRDAVGARPLIYQYQDNCLYFASEAKSLLGHVSSVDELMPGHYYSTKEGLQQFKIFIPDVPDFKTPGEASKILEELMVKSVKKRMNDGAVEGVSLSGGLDSSIIAAIAKSIDPEIKLFSTTIKRYPSKDIKFAKQMAQFLDLEHHIYEITDDDIKTLIPEAVWYMETFDEDCVSGAIANFYTSKMISYYTNCILVGEGADELFGGYFRELKDIPDVKEKEKIAKKLVYIAYNTALRRLDRGWQSNSVNYRTPFLDPEVVEFSNKIPMDLKVHYDTKQGRDVEKWILREALKGWLPEEIANRPKLRFAGGTGVDDLMDELTANKVSEEEYKNNLNTETGLKLFSPKELHYYRLFREYFPKGYESLVVRWDPFK